MHIRDGKTTQFEGELSDRWRSTAARSLADRSANTRGPRSVVLVPLAANVVVIFVQGAENSTVFFVLLPSRSRRESVKWAVV